MEPGANMNIDAMKITMHRMHTKTIPPITIPVHAMELPE